MITPVYMLSALRWVFFFVCLLPFVGMLVAIFRNTLGPDPADELAITTGLWTLRFLLLSLSITPLKNFTGWTWIFPFRRSLGLFALFYASLHFVTYIAFLLQFRWSEITGDILERPYITVGFAAYIVLVILGMTSNKASMRRMGRRWKQLHKLVYASNILGLLHLFWILRTDLSEAIFYGSILFPLLLYRVYIWYVGVIKKRKAGGEVV
jgi:sulfoxide reductase heme-binding subunit YedZ